jgi:serine/threonine protein kinase
MPLSGGQTFAGYRIIRLLGSGGMGEVYLAEHPRLPRQDALKVLPTDVSADPDYRARFNREADLASKLWHPNIVGVHDRGEWDGQLWISMDYVDGTDAARLLAERYPAGMPTEEVVSIVSAVASALDYAHEQGLLHRDVKPANIMLTRPTGGGERRVLLTDFGIARNVDDISGLTATNMTVGTVAYSPPEQLMGEEVDGRADQYALAATAYHLLAGRQLFPHSNPAVVISRHLNATPPALAHTRPDLADLDAVLKVALAKDPDNRFPRCANFARALEQAATPGTASGTAPTASAPAARKPDQHAPGSGHPRRWLGAAAMLAVSILIAAVALTWHPWHRGQPTTTVTTTAATSPPAVSTSSAAAAPTPAAAPTSAAPTATKVITVVPVVNGQPANGYREGPSSPDGTSEVFECNAAPAAVDSSIYRCFPSVADADVCWPSTPGTLLCLYNPWDKRLDRKFYTDTLPAAAPPSSPQPFALLLDDGTQCRLRNGGAWTVRNDGYLGAYGCPSDQPAVVIPAPGAPAIDRSHPLWTVKVGPLGTTNFPPPETHTVTTAWFAGN